MIKRIAILVLALLCGCAMTGNSGKGAIQNDPLQDITESFAWIGKTAEELGVDKAYIDSYGNIAIEGDLFGEQVRGTAFTQTDPDAQEPRRIVCEIVLYGDINKRGAAEEGLAERYGKAYLEGIDPYVASNGGAVYWSRYWTGAGVIVVSNGQKNDWYSLTYYAAEMPEEVQKQLAGLTAEELKHRTGVLFEFRDGEAEDLAIYETEFEGETAYRVTFTKDGTGVSAIIVKNGAPHFDVYRNDGSDWTQTNIEGVVDSLRCIRPDGTGRIVEKNIFNAFWLIETDAPVTPESLEALETFLLSRWLFKD